MSGIHWSQQQIDAYLDGELPGAEREPLLTHCYTCEICRTLLESRQSLLEAIHSARPFVKAPPGLRDKVTALLDVERSAQSKLNSPDQRRTASLREWLRAIWPILGYAMLLLALVGVGASWFLARRESRAARFVQMATETHQRELRGSQPVQFKSSSARAVTAWFGPKLPFALRLPTYQDDSGDRSKYQIIGGSLASFEGKAAAYVAYRMRNELISLLVVSTDQAVASGGEITTAKSIAFHSVKKGDLDVITWSVHHLTYALVSNLELPQRQSCVVCHADPKGHALLQSALTHSPLSCHQAPSFRLWNGQSLFVALPNSVGGTNEFLGDLQ